MNPHINYMDQHIEHMNSYIDRVNPHINHMDPHINHMDPHMSKGLHNILTTFYISYMYMRFMRLHLKALLYV
jgi:hypothetical protein